MNNIVKVKNLRIGEGIPKICVPIIGKNNTEIIEELKQIKKSKPDLVEWRVDYYQDVENLNKVKDILKVIRHEIKDLPILFTFRTKKEGGEKELSIEDYINLNKEIIATKLIDIIDIELFVGDKIVSNLIDIAHKNNIKVIISNHEFSSTPSKQEIINRLCKMQDLKCDICKIAVMPNSTKDLITLLDATQEMKELYSTTPIVTMSMGKLGMISRLSGEIFGSSITFGTISDKVSAPGQICIEELKNALDIIHKSV